VPKTPPDHAAHPPGGEDLLAGERARARYEEHLAHFLAREDLWAGDFDSSSHWLPQYLWIGLWLADGSP